MSDSTVIRGDNATWYISFTNSLGSPMDLTGCKVWFTAKPAVDNDAADSTAVITHHIVISGAGAVTSSDGMAVGGYDYNQVPPVLVSGVASGVITQTLSTTDSTALALDDYVYDIQLMDASGYVTTPINGLTLTITPDVTRRTTTP